MTVSELLARVSSRELSEWMAYYSIEPFGAERDNLHAGIIASATVNLWRNADEEPVKPQDWQLQFGAQDDVMPGKDSDLYALVKTWAVLNNGVTRGDDAEDTGG